QEEASREAEEGQEAHAADRRGRDPAVGLHRRAQDGQPLERIRRNQESAPRRRRGGLEPTTKPRLWPPPPARRPIQIRSTPTIARTGSAGRRRIGVRNQD